MAVFKIPRKLEDLEKEKPGQLCAPDPSCNDPEEACERCITKLEQAPLGLVNDQETFECAYVAVRDLAKVQAPELVKQLAVSMCKNLHTVAASGLQELGEHQYEKGNPAVVEHLSAVHAYTFFLSQIMQHSQASVVEAVKADALNKGAAGKKGRGKAKGAAADDGDGGAAELWYDISGRIARVLVSLLRADLDGVLYRVPTEKSSLLNLVVQAVGRCLGDPGVLKQTKLLGCCHEVLLLTATKHPNCTDAIEFVSSGLASLWKTHDHGVAVAVDLAVAAAKAGCSAPTRLGKALVGKFCEVSPEEYDEASKRGERDIAPVRRAGQLLASMAEKLPEVIHDKMSQLVNYLGCQSADTIRKHLVDCMGALTRYYMGRQANEAGNLALLTSRTNVAAMLLARANDKNAHVRKAVMNNIMELVEGRMWGHDILERTAEVAISRLEDSSLVAGAALELLTRMVECYSSLGGKLAEGLLMENVSKLEAQLEGMEPDDVGPDGEEGAGANAAMWDQGGALDAAATQAQASIIEPTQVDGDAAAPAAKRIDLTYSQIKLLLAILNAELGLARQLTAALPEVEAQLASDSAGVVESAIKLLTLLRRVQLEGVEDAWRRVWHMVFSNSEKVRNTVSDAFNTMISPETEPKDKVGRLRERINRLLPMMGGLDQRDTQALEELLRLALQRGDIAADTARQAVKYLHMHIQKAGVLEKTGCDEFVKACSETRRLSLLCAMLTRHAPDEVVVEAGMVVGMLKTAHVVLKDAVLVRDLAAILGELAAPPHRALHERGAPPGQSLVFSDALANLYSVLLSSYLPEAGGGWAAAAQAAIGAIYTIFPNPHVLLEPLLKELAEMIGASSGHCSAVLLTRAVFIVGCVATQQLALVDKLAKQVRKERTDREKAAAAGGQKGGEDDMDAQLGTGQARDAALDALQEELEAVLLRPGAGLVADWGGLVSGLCHRPDLLAADVALAAAALGALCKLMALDGAYCEANCSVFFTRLTGRGNVKLPTDVRCSMLVALGDLGRRHPNVVEPWTVRMFECLRDEPGEEEVARTCLRILAHLILSDMTKPKGHMAQVARCLVARDPAAKHLALQLFNSLAAKQAKGGKNQVMQYLPEIISDATRGQPMAEQDFKAMMQRLLGYIKQDKLTEQIKVRLVERMENVVVGTPTAAAAAAAPSDAQPAPSTAASQPAASASQPAASAAAMSTGAGEAADSAAAGTAASDGGGSGGGCSAAHMEAAVREWRGIAACLDMVPYSEKGLRMIMERFKCYKHTLGDEQVYRIFKGIAEHGRKGNRSPELKQEVAEYESRLEEAHNTLREEQMAYMAKVEAERAAAEADASAAAADANKVEEAAAAAAAAGAEETEAAGAESAAGGQEGDLAQMEEEDEESAPSPVPVAQAAPGQQSTAGDKRGGAAADAGQEESEDEGEEEDEDDDRTEAPASEGEGEEEGEEYADCDDGDEEGEDAMDMDVDMEDTEWQEVRETSAVSTPPSRRGSALASGAGGGGRAAAGRHDSATSAPTPLAHGAAAGTPMAITPAPGGASDGGDDGDDMAWSPAPAIAASLAAAAGAAAAPPQQQQRQPAPPAQQENVAPFGGFRIKPDPEAQLQQQQGPLGPMPGFGAGGGSVVLGVRIKPDPDARAR
ncbi:hypothetical protein HXX76_008756 [Chlamydomonas incerta]|uniref:Condensin complex subunit 1 n=1 Tax=Chlamydomonas incerta TaxID=51695 RepID=A0A835STQ1_CHLIN|nr:hypothetical protein HXX76_008756 [Chlamydomonas incerta]|eukprot:KAG2433029.1 hypothetical protein HXX76_008756 [Chlamydomonas incerta]